MGFLLKWLKGEPDRYGEGWLAISAMMGISILMALFWGACIYDTCCVVHGGY